jgi:S1-C subfamily serine protease
LPKPPLARNIAAGAARCPHPELQHMSLRLLGLALFLAAAALAPLGARAATYPYNGQKYGTAEQALAAHQRDLEAEMAMVKPSPPPAPGKVLIVIPDRDRLRPLVTGFFKTVPSPDALSYVTEFERQQLWAVANAIVTAHLFAAAQIVERNDTVLPDFAGYDYLVWYQVRSLKPNFVGPWVGVWLMRKAGSTQQLRPVVDPGSPVRERLARLVSAMRQGIARFNAPGAAAAPTAASSPEGLHRFDTGSGFVVALDGLVVTNNHVVASCGETRIVDRDGKASPATIRARDARNDLALLKTERRWSAAAQFRAGAAARQGDGVVAAGYPLSGVLGSQMNVTTGNISALSGLQNDSRFLQLTAPVQPGNSGGPLLDMSGDVVGVVSGKLNAVAIAGMTGDIPQNVNFAIKSALVRDFLDANAVTYLTAPAKRLLSPADVGDIARRFTVFVECWR